MHTRGLRYSSFKYSRYSQSSRLARGAPRPSRCDARLSPRAARIVSEKREHTPGRPAPPAKNRRSSEVVPREARLPGAREPVLGRAPGAMSWRQRWFPNGEWVLLVVLAGEILFF